jgi:hypothetical protein
MAARKRGGKRTAQRKGAPKRAPAPRMRVRSLLDADSRRYAALIADPCNAPLTHSTFPGAGGSIVSRFESDFLVANDIASTAFALYFTPGVFGTVAGAGLPGMVVTPNGVLVADTTNITWTNNATLAPGASFLNPTAKSFRSIAACLQIMWPGTELTRSGVVGVAQTTLDTAYSLNAENCANLRTLCSSVTRMPEEIMEIRLRPTDASFRFTDCNQSFASTTGTTTFADQPSLLVTASGFPVSTGVRVRLVNVIEWVPNVSTGIVNPDASYYDGTTTTQDVLRYIRNIDFVTLGHAAGSFAGSAASAFLKGGTRGNRRMQLEL